MIGSAWFVLLVGSRRTGAGVMGSTRLTGRVRGSSSCRGVGGKSGWPGSGAEPDVPVLEMSGPGPVPVEPQLPAAAGPDEPAGHGADAVAERGRLAAGEVAGEAQRLGPGEQVGCGQGQFKPDLVLRIAAAGQVAQPGGWVRATS